MGPRTDCQNRFIRILEVAPFVAPIDDREAQIGGAQVLLADLASGLAVRGHRVTLAAARGSAVRGVTIVDLGIDADGLRPAGLGGQGGPRPDDAGQRRAFAAVRAWLDQHAGEIDVVHAHAYDAPAFDLLGGGRWPIVHTLHLPPLDPEVVAAARRARGAGFVTVSRANAASWEAAGVRVRGVILNGVDLSTIPFTREGGRYLLHAGRISPEKGVDTALTIAARLGRELLLVGGVYDQRYHAEAVRPRVREARAWQLGEPAVSTFGGATYIGPRTRSEVHRLMGGAAAVLMPVRWDEPFGLVALEALATGTPVVAYRRGGLAEIIDPSCGALVEPGDETAFLREVDRAVTLDRAACRRRAERFPLEAMVTAYELELARA